MQKLFFGWILAGIMLIFGVSFYEQCENKENLTMMTDMKVMVENENYRERVDGTSSGPDANLSEESGKWNIIEDYYVVEDGDEQSIVSISRMDKQKEQIQLENNRHKEENNHNQSTTLTLCEQNLESDKSVLTMNGQESNSKIQLSGREKRILQRIVEAEATGESVEGRMLVANVVLNRVRSRRFPNSVEEVVFQCEDGVYQFSPIKDGRYYSVAISDKTKEAVERVLDGEDHSEGALYFMARRTAEEGNANWFDNSLTYVMSYGGHEFYQ